MIDPTTYLRRDNPRLIQLEQEYAMLDLPFQHTLWQQHQNVGVDIANFRADGAYLGQGAIRGEQQYKAMWEYVKAIDDYTWLDALKEDGDFGVLTYEYDGRLVSRDLCDSVMELKFIVDALRYLPQNWLDIGAGYGRLAHRLTTVSPRSRIICADAVPISSFLCEFYSQYRGFADKCHIGTLTELETTDWPAVDIACNIHSFSEMSAAAISFWLDKLVLWRVPYFFLVPHDPRFVCVNEDGSIGNFRPLVEERYELIFERSKYPDGIDGLYPEVVHYLWRLKT